MKECTCADYNTLRGSYTCSKCHEHSCNCECPAVPIIVKPTLEEKLDQLILLTKENNTLLKSYLARKYQIQ